jgi:diadenosine tetraphosphate (Ap4A) HIT family hydrolase
LAREVSYAKLNYLMLMMMDPHVHWHVIPRYEGTRELRGVAITDGGWPRLPQLAEAFALEQQQIEALCDRLRKNWTVAQ